jgi:dTDP-6-deoxy-L-talose 4-dehydrogenase (NAD+)
LPVEDAAGALVRLACLGRDNGVVNVCSGTPITVAQLVRGWIEANGWSIRLNLGYYPYPDYEPMAFWGDCRKLAACTATQ